jgi:glycosyltransferase involved in cell wall biosynthesis
VNILTLTNLFPNAVQPRKGIFVRERLDKMLEGGGLGATVVAPVPWFPSTHPRFGRYAEFAAVPLEERTDRYRIYHPRYAMIPKVGSALSPRSYFRAVLRLLRRNPSIRFDIIDSHFLFPDGAAAVMLGRALGCPVSVTARGSDVNVMPAERLTRRWISWTLANADVCIAVSRALGDGMLRLGAAEDRLHVLPNGVDAARFVVRPVERAALGIRSDAPVILSVGNLVPLKGHDIVIRALTRLAGAQLVIVGSGPERARLKALVKALGLEARVTFVADVSQEVLIDYYNAADVLVLASSAEGLPNVVLESLACGTPVVASAVGGIPEVIGTSAVCRLVELRQSDGFANAIAEVLAARYQPAAVRREISGFSWDETVAGVRNAFRACLGVALPRSRTAS